MASTLRPNAYLLLSEKRAMLCGMSNEELAYLAGLIDGEGTISFFFKRTTNLNQVTQPYVSISNTNIKMRDWILERIGQGSCGSPSGKQSRENGWKRCYNVLWTGPMAIAIIEAVFPFLVLKKPNAQWVLGLFRMEKSVLSNAGRTRFSKVFPRPHELTFQQNAAYSAVRRLNTRGVAA